MKCKKCGAELVSGAKFCMMCGAKAGLVCAKCGTELPDEAKFCFNCGAQAESEKPALILNDEEMNKLSQIKAQNEPAESGRVVGAPVWDSTPNGACDCAVGECDCDGSIWN